jgi:hypothetical protein
MNNWTKEQLQAIDARDSNLWSLLPRFRQNSGSG